MNQYSETKAEVLRQQQKSKTHSIGRVLHFYCFSSLILSYVTVYKQLNKKQKQKCNVIYKIHYDKMIQ